MKKGPRKQPQRTCIACRTVRPKRELVRVVRKPDGEVVVDTRGKVPGRGAYVCRQPECWQLALEQHRIERALEVKFSDEQRQALSATLANLAQDEAAA